MKKTFIKIVAALLLILTATISFAQHSPWVRFGLLDTSRVSIEEFNAQKEVEIQKGYNIDSATVLFGGANFPLLRKVNLLPEYDSIGFSELKELLAPGSSVNFQVVAREKATGKLFRASFCYIFYGTKKVILAPPSKSLKS